MAGQIGHTAGVGEHLRRWRTRRGLSQLSVAVECGVSTRHLSFAETGRARPSKQLIVHLARFLEPTNRELNVCLLAAANIVDMLVALVTAQPSPAALTASARRRRSRTG